MQVLEQSAWSNQIIKVCLTYIYIINLKKYLLDFQINQTPNIHWHPTVIFNKMSIHFLSLPGADIINKYYVIPLRIILFSARILIVFYFYFIFILFLIHSTKKKVLFSVRLMVSHLFPLSNPFPFSKLNSWKKNVNTDNFHDNKNVLPMSKLRLIKYR